MTFTAINCTGVAAPSYLSLFTASVSALLILVTVPGNLLVLITVYKDPNKELRTPFCLFVVNLAIADLIVGCVVEPISVVFHVHEGLSAGALPCNVAVIHMSYFISCTASVLSLAALTFDRFVAVEWPVKYRTTQSSMRAGIASFFIWFVSLSIPFVYFHVGYIMYAFVFANTSIIFTLFILVFAYMRILNKLRAQSKASASLRAGLSERTRTRLRALAMEDRVTKVFILVIAAYGCCYAPTCVLIYLMNFCHSCSCYSVHWFRDMQFVFVLINSSLNPFLYSWRLPSFKNAFRVILRRRSQKRRSSSATSVSSVFGQIWELRSKFSSESAAYMVSRPMQRYQLSPKHSERMVVTRRAMSLPTETENSALSKVAKVEVFQNVDDTQMIASRGNILDEIDINEISVTFNKENIAQDNTKFTDREKSTEENILGTYGKINGLVKGQSTRKTNIRENQSADLTCTLKQVFDGSNNHGARLNTFNDRKLILGRSISAHATETNDITDNMETRGKPCTRSFSFSHRICKY